MNTVVELRFVCNELGIMLTDIQTDRNSDSHMALEKASAKSDPNV